MKLNRSRSEGIFGWLSHDEEKANDLTKESVVGAGLVATKASGFAAYQGASVLLSTTSRAIGTTLSFSTYSNASVALKLLTGHIGWGLLGIATIWKLSR